MVRVPRDRTPLVGRRGLYVIVDPAHCGRRDPLATAEAALAGGCAVLQLRDKRAADGETRALAGALLSRCRQAGVPFVLNDHVELAAALAVDGLHLGQDDMPLPEARARVGGGMAIGVSTHDLAQARSAERAGADLIGFGPVFPTRTKENPDPVVGLDGLTAACAAATIPVVGIGGICIENARQVAERGADFAAVIGAVCDTDDPRAASRAISAALAAAVATLR